MKSFAVPTITAGLAAGLSVLFFLGLADRFGDVVLARIVLLQASVALLQMLLIPSAWVYLLGAGRGDDADFRYSQGISLEWASTGLGVLIILAVGLVIGSAADGAIFMFLSLATQASASTLGWLRAHDSWRRYVAWVLLTNGIRPVLIWLSPALVKAGLIPDVGGDVQLIALIFFLLPELVRLALIYLPMLVRHYRWPGFAACRAGATHIYKNWFFDVGSAATDQADKLLVGGLLGPQILVAYFFARRIGIVTVMVTEPFYWESFRRSRLGAAVPRYFTTWLQGIGFAGLLWVALVAGLLVTLQIPALARFVPDAVIEYLPLFFAVVLFDGLSAANRWSRFLAQITGQSLELLGVRLLSFGVFASVLVAISGAATVWSVVLAMAAGWCLDTFYVSRLAMKAELE